MNKIKILDAGSAIDDRGESSFANKFDMKKLKGFIYQIIGLTLSGLARIKIENKYVMVVQDSQ